VPKISAADGNAHLTHVGGPMQRRFAICREQARSGGPITGSSPLLITSSSPIIDSGS
jgi:hypothetical protein